jgi:hypothetical protein
MGQSLWGCKFKLNIGSCKFFDGVKEFSIARLQPRVCLNSPFDIQTTHGTEQL